MLSILGQWITMSRVMISVEGVKRKGCEDTMAKCVVCNCEMEEEHLRHIPIKGKPKKICKECVTAIKGFA
jgi:hypothetical protein